MDSKEIRSQIGKLLMEQQSIATHKDGWNSTRRAAFDARQKDVEQLEADLARQEAIEARTSRNESFERSARPTGANGGLHVEMSADEKRTKLNKAFRSYALHGFNGMEREERDLLTTSDTTGGALIPQIFSGVLVDALKFYGPTAQLVRQRVTDNTGAPLKISLDNDTANGLTLLATEGSSSPAETDPAFLSKIVGVDTVTGGLVKVSIQELEDSSFDLDTFIREKFSVRYGRGMEKAVTLGLDSANTTLPNQSSGGLAGVATVGDTTAALADGIGWDDLTTAFAALDPAYVNVNKTKWLMNSSTRGYLIGLKDGFGRPYFTPDPSADGPFGKLLGFDVVINQSLPNMGASAKPILLGSLQDAYLLRTDGQPSIIRLNERYMDTLEVGFYLFSRVGGTSIVMSGAPVPLVSIQQASS
ncbi:MAG: phage major capsid protein [Terracidiphilus sp.]